MSETSPGLSIIQKKLIKLFCGKRPTLYFPGLNSIFGWQLGLLLSQLAYWQGRGEDKNGWIYKTAKELQKETGLSFASQKTAISKGVELGIIEMAYRKVPRRRHYKVDWKRVAELAEIRAPKYGLRVSKRFMELGENQPAITKTTHETTSKKALSENSIGGILRKTKGRFFKGEHK